MTHRDDAGNVQVDFVWGNLPLQPNDDRLDNWVYSGQGPENVGWSGSWVYYSDALRTADYYQELNNLEGRVPADSHTIATTGYSNFPGYIANYAGDGDAELEVVVPSVLRMNIGAAQDKLDAVSLGFRVNYHNPSVFGLTSTGKTVRVYAYDENSGGPYSGWNEAYLVGLKAGDNIWVENSEYDFGPEPLTITAANEDGENSWIEFETAEDVNIDNAASGTIWPAGNTYGIVMMMRGWNQPGAIVNEGQNIYVRALAD